MDHHHSNNATSTLKVVFVLTFIFMIVEGVVGFIANSLSLIADAGHMLSDVFSLGLSIFAIYISQKPRNERYTFGYYRAEILAALFNGISLVLISFFIVREALERVRSEEVVLGAPLLVAATVGLLINIYGLYALKEHSHNNLNISSAFFHIFADLLGSIAAIMAGVMILITGNYLWDVFLSVAITVLILISGFQIIKQAIHILMQATPKSIDNEEISRGIKTLTKVEEVHDLHIWAIDQKRTMLTAHVVVSEGLCQHDRQEIMRDISEFLEKDHNIIHTTIQIEHPDPVVKDMNCGC